MSCNKMEYYHSNVNMNMNMNDPGQKSQGCTCTGQKSDPDKFYVGVLGCGPARTKRDMMMNKRFSYAIPNVHPNRYQK